MRLLLDEDSGSHSLLNALRDEGHDAERVVDCRALGGGASDEAVIAYAIAQNRGLITKNGADFVDVSQRSSNAGHPGVFVPHYGRDGGNLPVTTIVRAIANIAATYESTHGLFLDLNQHVW